MWTIIEVQDGKVIYRTEDPIFQHCFNKVDNKPKWVIIK
jgi:hypothetical protein